MFWVLKALKTSGLMAFYYHVNFPIPYAYDSRINQVYLDVFKWCVFVLLTSVTLDPADLYLIYIPHSHCEGDSKIFALQS